MVPAVGGKLDADTPSSSSSVIHVLKRATSSAAREQHAMLSM